MSININVLGLIFQLIGAFVLLLIAIIEPTYVRIFPKDVWWHKFWWHDWRPIFKVSPPDEKPRWMIKKTHWVLDYGLIPPKYKWNIIGFLFILIGSLLQLKVYLT